MKKKLTLYGIAVLLLVLLSACAAGPNPQTNIPDAEGRLAGFWLGLWHGIITPVTFVISLFNHNIHFYEVANNGNWYNIGYILGILISFGGSSGGAARRSKHQ